MLTNRFVGFFLIANFVKGLTEKTLVRRHMFQFQRLYTGITVSQHVYERRICRKADSVIGIHPPIAYQTSIDTLCDFDMTFSFLFPSGKVVQVFS